MLCLCLSSPQPRWHDTPGSMCCINTLMALAWHLHAALCKLVVRKICNLAVSSGGSSSWLHHELLFWTLTVELSQHLHSALCCTATVRGRTQTASSRHVRSGLCHVDSQQCQWIRNLDSPLAIADDCSECDCLTASPLTEWDCARSSRMETSEANVILLWCVWLPAEEWSVLVTVWLTKKFIHNFHTIYVFLLWSRCEFNV